MTVAVPVVAEAVFVAEAVGRELTNFVPFVWGTDTKIYLDAWEHWDVQTLG